MTEATGFEAKTIHRLLEVNPKGGGFKRGDDNPLDCDLLVVDETSMVDVMLMQASFDDRIGVGWALKRLFLRRGSKERGARGDYCQAPPGIGISGGTSEEKRGTPSPPDISINY
jgi:hypothetical protein